MVITTAQTTTTAAATAPTTRTAAATAPTIATAATATATTTKKWEMRSHVDISNCRVFNRKRGINYGDEKERESEWDREREREKEMWEAIWIRSTSFHAHFGIFDVANNHNNSNNSNNINNINLLFRYEWKSFNVEAL
jgi:hypothetical protein